MIYFAHSHLDGVRKLTRKYNLRVVPRSKFISERGLSKYATFPSHDALFNTVQEHSDMHAYVLADSKLHFHPDTVLRVVREAYQRYFSYFI